MGEEELEGERQSPVRGREGEDRGEGNRRTNRRFMSYSYRTDIMMACSESALDACTMTKAVRQSVHLRILLSL